MKVTMLQFLDRTPDLVGQIRFDCHAIGNSVLPSLLNMCFVYARIS
jgi:hypothetical protein